MSRIAILSNGLSHKGDRSLEKIRAMVAADPDFVHHEVRDMAKFPSVLAEIAAVEPEILVLNGGDGTVDAAITHIFNHHPFDTVPLIAILPSGKTNMTAADFGAKGSPDRLLARLVGWWRAGRLSDRIDQRQVMCVAWQPDGPPLYGFFLGTAAVVSGIEFCRRRIHPLGLPNFLGHSIVIAMFVAMTLWPWRGPKSPMRAEKIGIQVGGRPPRSGAFFSATVTTLNRLLLRIAPFARDQQGILKLTTVEHRVSALLRALMAIILDVAGKRQVAGMICENGDEIVLEFDCPFTLDGELYQPVAGTPVRLTASRPLRFIRFR